MKLYCLGDSNTYGYDPRDPLGGRYRQCWCDLLKEYLSCSVYNDGINGRTIMDALDGFDLLKNHIRQEQPNRLILLLGTNDILLEDLTAEAAAGRMEALLVKIRSFFPSLPLLLLSPPAIWLPGHYTETTQALKEHFYSLSQRFGAELLILSDLPLAYDGVHLSEEGHRQLAQRIKTAIT